MSSTRSVPAPSAPPNTRTERALRLYEAHHHEIERIGEDRYLVPACSARGGFYVVDYDAETCTCPDAEFHPESSCKRVLCVGIHLAKCRKPRTYSEHVEAARRDTAESYREECRRLMKLGKL